MLLTIDAGNSRTKWALFSAEEQIVWQGVCDNQTIASAELLPANTTCELAIVANVAGENHAQKLQLLLNQLVIKNVQWAKATPRTTDVINAYEKPETLGIDRWAALVAAWHMEQNICVVVNAGTAITIDGLGKQLENNQEIGLFKGGIIVPGLHAMQQTLSAATAQLPMPDINKADPYQRDIFAKNTADAMHAGAIHAISGAITLMSHHLNSIYKSRPRVILSGGHAKIIKENLIADVTRQAVIVDNLVLQGLRLIEKDRH
ncbi:MAG: type III pantothenate kinase [Methylophilaceae bacterium]